MKRYNNIKFIDSEITGAEVIYLDASGEDATVKDAVDLLIRRHATIKAVIDGDPVEIKCTLDTVESIIPDKERSHFSFVLPGATSVSIIRDGAEHVLNYEEDEEFCDDLEDDIQVYLMHKND